MYVFSLAHVPSANMEDEGFAASLLIFLIIQIGALWIQYTYKPTGGRPELSLGGLQSQ